jgi:hypothetical protein
MADAGAAAARLRQGLEHSSHGRWDSALADYDAALVHDPASAAAHFHRGVALISLDRPSEALASLDETLALHDDWRAHHFRGLALKGKGDFAAAIAAFDASLALAPGSAEVRLARGLTRLAVGRFAEGWPDYEARWDAPSFAGHSDSSIPADLRARILRSPLRADLTARRLLIVAEQGVGDVIMLASILPDVRAIAADVVLACEPRLHRLFETSFAGLRLTDLHTACDLAGGFDAVVGLGSLPFVFRQDADAFPGRPYLSASPAALERAAERLGPKRAKLRVGLSWRGGSQRTRRDSRSIALKDLKPITSRADLDLVSLQYGDVAAEIDAANRTLPRSILAPGPAAMEDFDDLAGLIAQMDIVVSVQTSVVHLCGAVGAPCTVLVPYVAEWRYGMSGETMPWYASVRLARQTAPGAWGPSIAAANGLLDARGAD